MRERDPLEREGTVWKVRAPVDAFDQVGYLITKRDLDRFRAVAIRVFSEEDPTMDLSGSERLLATFQGKTMRHSEWLRDGMATTLLHLALLHEQARVNVGVPDPETFVNDLGRDLPEAEGELAAFDESWAATSLADGGHAPDPLLSALEHLLGGDGKGILPVFKERDTPFPSGSHTNLLWALERLAWDPSLLPRITLDLAKLARVDPGGRLLPIAPIQSLNTIFKAWMPFKPMRASRNVSLTGH